LSADWARFSDNLYATKLHMVFDPNTDTPRRVVVTPGNINDITPAKALKIEPGATYVFDLAYYDYGWWAELNARGCRFVTRLKRNTRLTVKAEQPVPEGSDILSDRTGYLPARLARARQNPYGQPVREVLVRISTGKQIRLLTNDLDAPAQTIADLYKQRWQIELFFKWIKQNLKIKHFLGTSENAIRIQIHVALIAYLLLKMAHVDSAAFYHGKCPVKETIITAMLSQHEKCSFQDSFKNIPSLLYSLDSFSHVRLTRCSSR